MQSCATKGYVDGGSWISLGLHPVPSEGGVRREEEVRVGCCCGIMGTEHHDVYLTGEEAVKYGIATELGEFAPPLGTQVYKAFAPQ